MRIMREVYVSSNRWGKLRFLGRFTTEEMWCVLSQLTAEYEYNDLSLHDDITILL